MGWLSVGEMLQRAGEDFDVRRWTERAAMPGALGSLALTFAVALAYAIAARLSLYLLANPDGVAVFWPAAGISSGLLIALGRAARWPVAIGTMAATIVANLLGDRTLAGAIAMAVCNAGEALIVAGLVERSFGRDFNLRRLRHVLGLLAAAAVATIISGLGGAVSYKLFHNAAAPFLTTWEHWFASDAIGIITVAPLVIKIGFAIREPPPRSEFIEGGGALIALAAMAALIVSLPERQWETVLPMAWLLPIQLWLAARCRPVFSAAGAFLVSTTIVWTTVFGIGHFGDPALPIEDRVIQAQAAILLATIGALVLAALFAERRESEARLALSNELLERERDNKLLNAQAITAAIAHEVRQPLAGIVASGSAAVRFLKMSPPDHVKAEAALDRIVSAGHRTSEVFDGLYALFGKGDQERQLIEVNEIILSVLDTLRADIRSRNVELRIELASEPARVEGDRRQLQEVISNLVMNAIEAMDATDRSRILHVRTESRERDLVVVFVEDSGPGIDPHRLSGIFNAFVTTKSRGMGLGLAICRMIVEHHGGKLTASSDGRSGASFQFVLPVASVSKDAAPAE
jgi:signal transduction histidine kinase